MARTSDFAAPVRATNGPIEPENEQTLEAQAPAASAVYQSDISYTDSSMRLFP
jgi:hypothetical protein